MSKIGDLIQDIEGVWYIVTGFDINSINRAHRLFPADSEFDRHEYSVMEASRLIHGAITGSGDAMDDDGLGRMAEWLAWRITDGWIPSSPRASIGLSAYENAVQNVGRAAVRMAMLRSS